MAITDAKLRAAKPKEKDYKLADERGMFLLVKTSGARYWRMKYRHLGKEKLLALGVYPEVTLAAAREARDQARQLLKSGIDPVASRRAQKAQGTREAENSFAAIAAEWFEKQRPTWAETTAKKRQALITNDLSPWLGKTPINHIDTADLLRVLQRIEDRGAIDTAHNARQVLNQIFRFAKQTRRATENPATDLAGALRPARAMHRPAITDPDKLGILLNKIDGYSGTFVTRCLLKLCPMLFQRPNEMASMMWEHIDWDCATWTIPEINMKKTKASTSHTVPLPEQALEILQGIQPLTGNRPYVFPNVRNPRSHASPASINKALRGLGVDTQNEHCAHGFRATARTLLDEQMDFRIEWIEQQLAHQVRDSLGRAYNRTKHLRQRRDMMQAWANYLDTLKAQAADTKVVVAARFR